MRSREAVRRSLRAAAARMPDVFAPGARLVVGFSGGQDSTCLVHALTQSRLQLEIVAAHVDHGLRADSAADAERVIELARGMQVGDAVVRRVDVAAYRKSLPGWSVQQAARSARYQALAAIGSSVGAAAVLVAHTADDQAETVLLHLLRGAGLAGLAGMRADEIIRPAQLGPPLPGLGQLPAGVRLVRPLLKVPRSTTLAYCSELGLRLVEDASNQSRAFARNRVRLDLVPVLEGFNPSIRAVLARTADLAAEDLAAMDALVDELHARLARTLEADVVEYDLRLWQPLPRALKRRLLRRGLETLSGDLVDVRAAPIDDALEVLQSAVPSRTYHLPDGVELCIQASTFQLRLHGAAARPRRKAKRLGVEVSRV